MTSKNNENGNENGGRVTTREFYNALLKQNQQREEMERRQNQQREEMERRLNKKIDAGYDKIALSISGLKSSVDERVETVEKKIQCINEENAAIKTKQEENNNHTDEIKEDNKALNEKMVKLNRADRIWGGISALASAAYATIMAFFLNK